MDNVEGTQGVPLTVFGGAVPELAPEDLPEGASPFNQDCDYNPGSVFTRGGRQNQIVFGGLPLTVLPGFAASIAGANAPNEVAWGNPTAVQFNTPGVYASTEVNHGLGGGTGSSMVDFATYGNSGFGLSSSVSGTTNSLAKDLAIFLSISDGGAGQAASGSNNAPAAFSNILGGYNSSSGLQAGLYGLINPGTALNITGSYTSSSTFQKANVTGLLTFPTNGSLPVFTNIGNLSGVLSTGSNTWASVAPVTAGMQLLYLMTSNASFQSQTPTLSSFSDNKGNTWVPLGSIVNHQQNTNTTGWYGCAIYAFVCSNPAPALAGALTFNANVGSGSFSGSTNSVWALSNLQPLPSFANSQILHSIQFPVTLQPGQQVLGLQAIVTGHQNSSDPSAVITVTPTGGTPVTTTLPTSVDGPVTVGSTTGNFGLVLTPALVSNPNFGIDIVASAAVDASFFISGVQLRLWLTPFPSCNVNYIKTYDQTDAEVDTIVLDANGVLWDEDVDLNPGVLQSINSNILPNTYAKSVTFADIEYIAFSNLLNGTDVPRQWNGTNLDRISMVGPGAAPTAASSGGTGSSSISVQNITQQPATQLRRVAWGNSFNAINDSTPGSTLVFYGEGRTYPPYTAPPGNFYQTLPPYNASFGAGTTVIISGVPSPFPKKGGGSIAANINGKYTVQLVTMAIVGGAESVPVFTTIAPFSAYGYSSDFGSGGTPTSGWFYQSTLATATLQAPLPGVGVGSTITFTGTGGAPPTAYDGSFTVLQAPNTSLMTVTSAGISGGTATYNYTLLNGTPAPTVGQNVVITNCIPTSLNTSGTGAQIQSASGGNPTGSFSIQVSAQDTSGVISQSGLNATATVAGTTFIFDPTQIVNGGSAVNGGSIVQQGLVATGIRKVCYSFLTRSGFITQPSPLAQSNVTVGSGSITVNGLATGPPNVVARIVSFTGAGGANFFYIPQAVNLTIGGLPQINTSTIVNDNTSTSATFSFSDAVLLSATAIDIPGNNTFNTIELGSCTGLTSYASRLVAWGEQAKITNLRNLSFDGGSGGATISGSVTTYPLGWALDPTYGAGGSLNLNSPVSGWAYQISNTSGSTMSVAGLLTQNAYQDEFGVAIVQANTLYSVRICASCNPVPGSGNLVVDLSSQSRGIAYGTFSIPLSSMTKTMAIYTGTLLTQALAPVVSDLVIRIWAQNIPNGTTILIDRVEPFQTYVPSFTTQLKLSYANNQEAFDLTTGVCGPAQNMQPINGALELFDLLYALKERSWFSTFDNGVTEPNAWNWKTVSNKTGTVGIHSYDWGEGWLLTGDREGVHFFEGGEPIKVSQEIQPLWDMINWQYGYSIWVRNDPEQRRFTVGVPIPTPNIYMPEFPVNANPTSPNVILMCNYRELNTGSALASTGPIRSTYTGRLMSPEPARKWSFWSIACPYSDFIDRNNNTWPQWFATGYNDSKIFALAASQLSDDGNAINSFWVSYGFVKAEMQDAKGLGLFRMEFPYCTLLAIGNGTLNTYVYPESPQNQPYVLDPLPLPSTTQGDLEVGVNVKGNRFFVRVGTNAVGANFRLSKIVVPLIQDSWSPVRGYNAVKA